MANGEANVDRVSPSETWDLPTQVEKNAAVQLLSLHGKPAHRASGGGHAGVARMSATLCHYCERVVPAAVAERAARPHARDVSLSRRVTREGGPWCDQIEHGNDPNGELLPVI